MICFGQAICTRRLCTFCISVFSLPHIRDNMICLLRQRTADLHTAYAHLETGAFEADFFFFVTVVRALRRHVQGCFIG